MPFDVDELVDGILAGDAADQVAFVVQDAIGEVVGYADVECAVAFAGEDVGAVAGDHDCWLPYTSLGVAGLGHFEIPIRRTDTSDRAAFAGPTYRAVRRIGMT